MEENRRQSSFGWLGWVFFFILIFGSRFAPSVATWLSQATGLNITAGGLMGTVAVLYIASLILGPILGMIMRNAGGGDSSGPTLAQPNQSPSQSPFPPSNKSNMPQLPPPSTPRLPQTSTPRLPPMTPAKTPGAPRWEPIIDPRILIFGIIGIIVLGGFFLVALLLAGSI